MARSWPSAHSKAGDADRPDRLPGPESYAACCALLWSDSLSTAEIALTMAARGGAAAGSTAPQQVPPSASAHGPCSSAAGSPTPRRMRSRLSGARARGRRPRCPRVRTSWRRSTWSRAAVEEAEQKLEDPAHRTRWEDGPRHAFHLAAARAAALRYAASTPPALEDFLEAGRRMESLGIRNPAVLPWRSRAAVAAAGAQDQARAMSLAAEEVQLARAFGADRAARRGPPGRGTRRRAGRTPRRAPRGHRACLERSPAALDRARALIDLGAEQRRVGQRKAARDSLRSGLDLAQRCEASALAARGT